LATVGLEVDASALDAPATPATAPPPATTAAAPAPARDTPADESSQ